jgi:hypothetical protein
MSFRELIRSELSRERGRERERGMNHRHTYEKF